MYNELSTYIDARIAEVNATITGTADDLIKIDAMIDISELPENQKHNRYMLKIEEYTDNGAYESKVYDGEALIELSFLIPNSDTVKYKNVLDNYIHVLLGKIRDTPKYNSGSTFKSEIVKVGCSKMNNFEEGEFKPEIKLTFKVFES